MLGEFRHAAIRAQHDRNVVERFPSLGIPLTDAGSSPLPEHPGVRLGNRQLGISLSV